MLRSPRVDSLRTLLIVWLASGLPLVLAQSTFAQDATPHDLGTELEKIRNEQNVPGLVAAVVVGDRLVAVGASGKRKLGAEEALTVDDKLHLGSCTKAMTASLLAILIAEGELSWEDTPTDCWNSLERKIDPGFRETTLRKLLAHRSGVKKDVSWYQLPGKTPRAQRARLVHSVLAEAPAGKPGDYLYSNVGYAIAGAMAERVTGESWQTLMQTRLFEPLGIQSAGFGPPSTQGQLDQPWGHVEQGDLILPTQFDNAPSLGPAGTVHMSISDWARFASLHLKARPGEPRLLSDAQIDQLHEGYSSEDDNNYGYGWIVVERPWAGGQALTHSGSNTSWFATLWIAPRKNIAFLAVTNTGAANAHQTCDQTIARLIQLWRAEGWK